MTAVENSNEFADRVGIQNFVIWLLSELAGDEVKNLNIRQRRPPFYCVPRIRIAKNPARYSEDFLQRSKERCSRHDLK